MRTRRKLLQLLAVLLTFTWVACDQTDPVDENDDDASEMFVGDWNLSGADDDSGSRLSDLGQFYAFPVTASFTASGNFELIMDSIDEARPDVMLMGTFTATESTQLLRLTTEFGGQAVTLVFSFEFPDGNEDEFSISTTTSQTAVLNAAIGTDFQGPTTLTFTAVVE